MATQLKNIQLTKIALCEQGANSEAFIQLFKNKEGGQEPMNFDELLKSLPEDQQALVNAEIAKAKEDGKEDGKKEMEGPLADEKAKREEAEAELAKSVKKPEVSEEEMLKSLSPEMATMFKSLKAQKEAAEALAKSVMEKELETESLAKSATLKDIPVEQTEIASLYKSLKGKDSTLAEQVFSVLEKANAAIGNSDIFNSKGTSGEGGAATGGNPDEVWAEIEKAAEPIAKSKNISIVKATNEVITNQPELYKRYLDAMKAN